MEVRKLSVGEQAKYHHHHTGELVNFIVQEYHTVYVDVDGLLHNIDVPAFIDISSGFTVTLYCKHGMMHRVDGPAEIIERQRTRWKTHSYYINNKEYNKKQFDEFIKDLNKDEIEMMSDLGYTF